MNFISAAGAIAALVGAGADGFVDTKYAFKPDGTERTVLGMSPGIFVGVSAAVIGAIGLGMGHNVFGGLLAAGSVGVLAAEGMRFVANRTAAQMQQGTQGFRTGYALPGGSAFALPAPQQAANANGFGRGGVSPHELEGIFGQINNYRRAA